MKCATGMKTCTKIYFLFISSLVQVIPPIAILTLRFDDVTVKTIYKKESN